MVALLAVLICIPKCSMFAMMSCGGFGVSVVGIVSCAVR